MNTDETTELDCICLATVPDMGRVEVLARRAGDCLVRPVDVPDQTHWINAGQMQQLVRPAAYGRFSDGFLSELVSYIAGRAVLEVFAGNGFLASLLARRGVNVHATSRLSGHDGHQAGMHFAVEEMDARDAVRLHHDRQILLMSWPTTTEAAADAVLSWGPGRSVVYIGEVTDIAKGQLGGCATDRFFEITQETYRFSRYRTSNRYEHAAVRELTQVTPGL